MLLAAGADLCRAQGGGLPAYLSDRGEGIPTSLFGTYIREKEFLFYPFYEYTRTNKFEYSPREVGVPYTGNEEFFGKTVEREALIFLAYAFSDSLALEFESALHSSVEFTRAPGDSTGTPDRIRESGLGDTEINLRWRYAKETARRPEITFFFKTVFPLQKKKVLLGTQGWEFEPGFVLTKGYPFGTLAFRASAAYDRADRKAEFAEWAVDYLKRINSKWRGVLSLEADQFDEVSLIGELQYSLGKNAVLKLNTGVGLVKKAPSFAPEIGVMFTF
jgi:hypothetical protein